MNILHICSITNNKASGIAMVVPEHYLYQSKYENVAILNCNNIVIEKLKNKENVFYYKKNLKCNIKNIFKFWTKPDIVVFHGVYIKEYIIISKFFERKGIPYIVVPHGSLTYNAQKIKKVKKMIGNLLCFNSFINKSNCIQYLSEQEKKMSAFYKKKSFIAGNGIEKLEYRKTKFSSVGLKLIYVGRYDIYHKGIDILIEGCSEIKDFLDKNKISLALYGRGNDGKSKIIELVKKYSLEHIITVNDAIYGDEKINRILESDVFIQVSRLEGQPLGVMEAFMLGMPVILSNGATFEKIEEYNMGYIANNSKEVGEAIVKCYNERQSLNVKSDNSVKFFERNLVWDNVAKFTISNYKKILEENQIDT